MLQHWFLQLLPRSAFIALAWSLISTSFLVPVSADEGNPLAVRRWPNGQISIETHWNLTLAINPNEAALKLLPCQPDQTIKSTDTIDHQLFRRPNDTDPTWAPASEVKPTDPNAITVRSVGKKSGTAGEKESPILLAVDGVKILLLPNTPIEPESLAIVSEQKNLDLLIVTFGNNLKLNDPKLIAFVSELNPKRLLINPLDQVDADLLKQFGTAISADGKVLEVPHNSLAVSTASPKSSATKLVSLTTEPWSMPADMETLFTAMEAASKKSQAVFAKLSVEQMNFKPENGTHTPRWNSEHMMGRQLGFFSQIYHQVDESIPMIDLNPKQMPPDYEFAHPQWNGAEEARQTERVAAFARRFAYLLDGMKLADQAPGSRWPSLAALLKQMERHYGEHTENTIKKFELPGWPEK